jgi:hypothetical protein
MLCWDLVPFEINKEMKYKDQQLLEEAYQAINTQFSLEEALDPRITQFDPSLSKKFKNILNSDVPKDIKLASLLNAVAMYAVPQKSSVESDSRVQEGLMDSLKEFKTKFANFSVIELIRLFKKFGDILDSYSKREIPGMEAIELVAASWNHFKTKTGFLNKDGKRL